MTHKQKPKSAAECFELRIADANNPNDCVICGKPHAVCAHTKEERHRVMGIFRGESAYDRCEEAGWNVMAPPRHMKWTDCYRTGNRRAFVLKVFCKEAGRSYSYIVEGFPYRDSFGRSAWKQGCVLFTDQNLPPSLIAADLAVA